MARHLYRHEKVTSETDNKSKNNVVNKGMHVNVVSKRSTSALPPSPFLFLHLDASRRELPNFVGSREADRPKPGGSTGGLLIRVIRLQYQIMMMRMLGQHTGSSSRHRSVSRIMAVPSAH
ncbi:hypothetical protein INR49_013985 [Caranx melampygus]|nr:hypothetical protein INR49_013985 [Caranx melampygus]